MRRTDFDRIFSPCTLRYVMFYSKATGIQLAKPKELTMKPYWKVGDLAKLTGITVRTLRYYDQFGLFSPSSQTESENAMLDALGKTLE
jgi:hypothetical protein